MLTRSYRNITGWWDFDSPVPSSEFRAPRLKGSSPAPPAPPPEYIPPAPLTPPPEPPKTPSLYEQQESELKLKQKEQIAKNKKGRGGTILTGLLTSAEAPAAAKPKLQEKLGA